MKKTIIKDVMSVNLITLHPKDKISRAKEIFRTRNVHHIPVVINLKVVGILSLGDVLAKENEAFDHMLKVNSHKNVSMGSVDEIMTKSPITIGSSKDLRNALKIMYDKRINCIPIEDEEKIVGIITSHDVIEFLLTAMN